MWVPLPTPRPPAQPPLPGPGVVILAARHTGDSGQLEILAAPSGHPAWCAIRTRFRAREEAPAPRSRRWAAPRGSRAPSGSRGWRRSPQGLEGRLARAPGQKRSSAGVSAVQQEMALQRLLELHREARHRRRQDREQQRLRVLERLRIARNRHCRVHPLGPPPNPAQLPPQEDAAGQRRALREQLERAHRERTGRLRALGARNTQNFQQLLWPPGDEEPGEYRSPFPDSSSHC
nr:uncharacterized protein LOC116154064 [Camelus dromedarius]